MREPPSTREQTERWRTQYHAAIQETDKRLIPSKVSAAVKVILARQRELFYNAGTMEEKEALEDALYLLRALNVACQHSEEPA